MKRLILEMGSGADLYGMDYTKDPEQVDVDRLMAEVPRGNPQINVVFGGHNITTTAGENPTVVATCAIEAFVPDLSQDWSENILCIHQMKSGGDKNARAIPN